MKCKTPEELIMFDLLTAIINDMPAFICSDFHHRKKDRHEIHDVCPIQKRFIKHIDEAKSFLSETPTASLGSQG